jgi:anti-anti-sigma regulatory factor
VREGTQRQVSSSARNGTVVFDPGQRSLLDASLLSYLSRAGRSLALEGTRLRVVCPDIHQRRLLALAGFAGSFDLIESTREAG